MHGAGLQVFYSRRQVQSAANLPKMRNLPPSHKKCIREKVSRELRREVMQKNHQKCYCCDAKNNEKSMRLELHHIVPVSFGGKTEANNLLPLCFNCHKSVHNLIDKRNLNPLKFKRSVLEDIVLQIAELRASERARQFGRMEPQSEGIMKTEGGQQLSPEQMQRIGLIFFTLSFALNKKQFRIMKKELSRSAWKEQATAA